MLLSITSVRVPALTLRLRRLLVALTVGLSLAAQAQLMPGGADAAKRDALPGGTGVAAGMAAPFSRELGGSTGLPSQALAIQDAGAAPSAAPLAPREPAKPLVPSQFQRFVEQATGRLLPVYGRELFANPQAYAPDGGAPAPADYILGPGDEIKLQVWGAVDFAGNLTVDRNGQVNLPKAGAVTLAGVATRDLENVLRKHLGQVFTNFKLNANPGRLRSLQVYVVGQAQQPGATQVSGLSTLVNAVFASGGPTANGSMRAIQLKRGGQTVTTLDLYEFIARGDKAGDAPLLPGDVIVIPPVGPRVALTGALDQAAVYELKPGQSTLGDILGLSGGVSALVSTQKALIERIDPAQKLPRQVQEVALNGEGLRQPLRDGDIITLLPISPAFANAVTLQGAVANPLRHRWFEGMTVLDLIPEREALVSADYYKSRNQLVQMKKDTDAETAAGVTERVRSMAGQINWDYAVIERLNREQLRTELIPFHLGKAVIERDAAHNLPLQPGDIVTIMSNNDLRLPVGRQTRLVRVEGEVVAPGVYPVEPGETLPQLLKRIGGLTPQAYVFGTEMNRESVRKRQQENLDTLIRKLEAQQESQAADTTTNLRADNPAQAQAQLQQQQQHFKSQIARLKSMRSAGRIALELDPDGTDLRALPALPLEDGDRVLVPSVPSFVAAFGSVNNENAFIYRTGKTVGDVLKTAGLTEDAEPGQAFVLRADGSIVARRDSGFFGGFESLDVMPGDTVVVPAQMDRESRYNFWTRALKDWTQIFANLGLGVAAINSISN